MTRPVFLAILGAVLVLGFFAYRGAYLEAQAKEMSAFREFYEKNQREHEARFGTAEERMEGMRAAHRLMIDEWTAALTDALEAGDWRTVADTYADDAVLIGPGFGRLNGRAAIDAHWVTQQDVVDWSLGVDLVKGEGELLAQIGTSTLTRRDQQGLETTETSDYVLVWHREDWTSHDYVIVAQTHH